MMPVIKMIDALSCPAYLITTGRVVVATNKAAQEIGVNLGEQCHLTICKTEEICPYCRLEESVTTEQIIKTNATISEKRYLVYWLYLENGIVLHYFIHDDEMD